MSQLSFDLCSFSVALTGKSYMYIVNLYMRTHVRALSLSHTNIPLLPLPLTRSQVRRPKDYNPGPMEVGVGGLLPAPAAPSNQQNESPHKLFIGGIPNYLDEEQVCGGYECVFVCVCMWLCVYEEPSL